jgi:hypothetical protein
VCELLEAALAYAAMGWRVFPVNGKAPRTRHGFKDAVTDERRIRDWWGLWPRAGVATPTGAGRYALDVDDEAAVSELPGALPPTVVALTGGGGRHLWFAHDGRLTNSPGGLPDGIHFRGDGGYVVLPPSPHPDGGSYEWLTAPYEHPLAPLPAWLLELLAPSGRNGLARPVEDELPQERRNTTLTSLAGSMRRRGMSEEEILIALLAVNERRCRPPLPEREVERIAASVARYPLAEGAGEPLDTLAALMRLPEVDVMVTGVTMFGQGGSASIDIGLSNGETMRFQSVREMIRPQVVIAELVACAGATPEINQSRCVQIVRLARALGERVQVDSDDADSRSWGIEFLQETEVIDFSLGDQAECWRGFELISRRDPWTHAREHGGPFASACITLRDTSGDQLVRAEWFLSYVRRMAPRETPATLRSRMQRVGWQRRGTEGRIKATAPRRAATLQWAFWIVPAGWVDDDCR